MTVKKDDPFAKFVVFSTHVESIKAVSKVMVHGCYAIISHTSHTCITHTCITHTCITHTCITNFCIKHTYTAHTKTSRRCWRWLVLSGQLTPPMPMTNRPFFYRRYWTASRKLTQPYHNSIITLRWTPHSFVACYFPSIPPSVFLAPLRILNIHS
jgi:hypothetical protein